MDANSATMNLRAGPPSRRTREADTLPPRSKSLLVHLYRALPALLAVGFGVYVMRGVDVPRVSALLGSLGWTLPLLVLPAFATTLIEAVAWWGSFTRLGGRPRFSSLLRVRLSTEALMLGLPSGALISESLQPYLLKKRCGVPLESAVVASVGRKFFVVVSHGIVMVLGTLLLWPMLAAASRTALGRNGLPWVLLGSGVFMILAFGVSILAGASARLAERSHRALDRLLGAWIGGWLQRNAVRFQRADEQLVRFFKQEQGGLVAPTLLYCAGWVARGVETLLFLHLLGADLTLTTATVLESSIVLVRSVAVPVPGGLGVQDAAYVLSLRALGVPDAMTVGAALVLLKRGRDLFWIVLGLLFLGTGDRSLATTSAAPSTAEAPQA